MLTEILLLTVYLLVATTLFYLVQPSVEGERLALEFDEWFYFIITTVTTVGDGDVTLKNRTIGSTFLFVSWLVVRGVTFYSGEIGKFFEGKFRRFFGME